jgi:nicotinamide phosphoribosyltransferase
LLAVFKENGEFVLKERATWEEVLNCEFVPIFKDGELLFNDSLAAIRQRLMEC